MFRRRRTNRFLPVRKLGGSSYMIRRPRPFPFMAFYNTLASRAIRKHRYHGYSTFTTIAGQPVVMWQWRANSMFDPDYSGGGHQPFGFDQMQTYWSEYRVLGVHFKYTVSQGQPNDTAMDDCLAVTNVWASNVVPKVNLDPAVYTASPMLVYMFEQPMTSIKLKRLYIPAHANGKVHRTIRGFIRMRQFYRDKAAWDTEWVTTASNPNIPIYLQCGVVRKQGGNFGGTELFPWSMTMTFICQYRGQKKIGES